MPAPAVHELVVVAEPSRPHALPSHWLAWKPLVPLCIHATTGSPEPSTASAGSDTPMVTPAAPKPVAEPPRLSTPRRSTAPGQSCTWSRSPGSTRRWLAPYRRRQSRAPMRWRCLRSDRRRRSTRSRRLPRRAVPAFHVDVQRRDALPGDVDLPRRVNRDRDVDGLDAGAHATARRGAANRFPRAAVPAPDVHFEVARRDALDPRDDGAAVRPERDRRRLGLADGSSHRIGVLLTPPPLAEPSRPSSHAVPFKRERQSPGRRPRRPATRQRASPPRRRRPSRRRPPRCPRPRRRPSRRRPPRCP